MSIAKINSFAGLVTSLAQPAVGSAKSTVNFLRHKVRGWLATGVAYAKKFPTSGASDVGLPQITDATGSNYLAPITHRISNLVWKDIHNFYVPDHGGRTITVLIGTYSVSKFYYDFTTNPPLIPPVENSKSRFGVFVRPYWNGSSWVDSWRELTEMYIFNTHGLTALGSNKILIESQGYCQSDGVDPSGLIFNTSYFNGWTIVYNESLSTENNNYDRVASSGFTYSSSWIGNVFYLQTTNTSPSPSGTIAWVFRNFTITDFPQSIVSYILTVYNQVRLTTGNLANDVSLRAAFASKTIIPTTHVYDQLIIEAAGLDLWRYMVLVIIGNVASSYPVPALTRYYKFSVLLGSEGESELKNCFHTGGAGYSDNYLGRTFFNDGTQALSIDVALSHGTTTPRFSGIRLYVSTDDLKYYVLKDYLLTDLLEGGSSLFGFSSAEGVTVNHYYKFFVGNPVTGAEIAVTGTEAITDLERALTEKGIIRYKTQTIIGRTTFIGNTISMVAGATAKPNQIMQCATDGDGVVGIDIYPSDGAHIIDVEYSDGDSIVALSALSERLFCLKQKSIVLLSPDGQGGWNRELVTRQVGCCSQNTVVSFDDVVYFADYTGIYSYDTRGLKLLNLQWLEDWKSITSITKEAMCAEIDKANKQYLLISGTTVYRYDLIDAEWMTDVFPDSAIACAVDLNVDGTIDFLTITKLETINRKTLSGSTAVAVDFDGAGYNAVWESNKIYPLRDSSGEAFDILLKGISIEYSSNVSISVDLYLDDGTSILTSTLVAGKTFQTIYAPLSSVCKAYRVKFSVAVAIGGSAPIIKSITHYFDVMPSGGDINSR